MYLQKLVWLFLALVVTAPAAPVGPPVSLRDVRGALVRPLAVPGRAATVLIFIAHDCPISNAYAPEIKRLRADYSLSHVGLYVVYTDSGTVGSTLAAHAKAHGYGGFALQDPTHALVKSVGATVTPEAVVFGPDARVLYEGRIDDRFSDLGRGRDIADVHDLRRALDAVRQGKSVTVARTVAVGCDIVDP